MVRGDLGEVVLQHGQGAGQRHVAAAAEQRHAGEAEDGGHQGGVGHPAQTLDAALEASCRGRRGLIQALFHFACSESSTRVPQQHFSLSGAASG